LSSGSSSLFIADTENHRIRSVSLTGNNVITTVAGTGSPGYNNDGIHATAAWLSYPYACYVKTDGSYILLIQSISPFVCDPSIIPRFNLNQNDRSLRVVML
jgi:hypothetical protein